MNQQQKGECDANQIKQASDQSRGATNDSHPTTSAYLIDRDGQQWRIWGGNQQLQATRDLDTPTPPNESDALWRERHGKIDLCGDDQ